MQEKSVGAKGKNGKRIPILQEKSGGAKGKTDSKFPVWFDNSIGYRGKTNEKIPVWLEKVRHGRKITADRNGKRRINSDMVGKSPTWSENYGLQRRETPNEIPIWLEKFRHCRKTTSDGGGKIPILWEFSINGEKKMFRYIDHLVLRHPSYMWGFTSPISLSVASSPQTDLEW